MAYSQRSIDSLLSLTIDHVIKHLATYMDQRDSLKSLPPLVKDRMLQKFTATTHFWGNVNFQDALCVFAHPMLRRIDLTLADIGDDILETLKGCDNLREVYLTKDKNFSITSNALITFVSRLKSLYLLQVSNCHAVNDEVLKTVSRNCSNLAGLDVSSCENISDCGIRELSNLHNLTWLTFSSTKVSNTGISKFVAGPSGTSIKELRVANCKNITSEILSTITQCCPNIEVLVFLNTQTYRNDDDCSCFSFEKGSLKKLKQLTWTVQW